MLLNVKDLRKTYPGQPPDRAVLKGVNLALDQGETLALTGESGSGKSTLLHLVAGLDSFDSGEIEVSGQPLSRLKEAGLAALRRGPVAVVFQQFNLVPSLTVAQNIALHARLCGRYDPAEAARMTGALGLAGFEDRYPDQLSGGQQQRVAIGRALAAKPALLLADEPTGNLDEAASDSILSLMLDLVAQSGTGLLLVTHSMPVASRLQRRLHLSDGLLQ
jgi:putative ABC transport system ATP-binding protein